MELANLLAEDGVSVGAVASSKRQALHLIADFAAPILASTEARVFAALAEREALGSTGLGCGVAVPHARVAGLDRVTGVFLRFETPIPFAAVDDRPVDLFFALFAPPSAGAEHLRALAAVSRALRAPEVRERLRQAKTVDAVRAIFVRDGLPATAA